MCKFKSGIILKNKIVIAPEDVENLKWLCIKTKTMNKMKNQKRFVSNLLWTIGVG